MSASQPLPFVRLQPKRLRADAGLDSLYPYYAGFSQRFVEALLRMHAVDVSTVVLDPWNGSGTTTAAAQRSGASAFGIDLNPFATIIARAKLATTEDAAQARDRARVLGTAALAVDRSCPSTEPLLLWMPPAAASIGRTLMQALRADGDPCPADCILAVAFARACRRIAPNNSSNPTWVRPFRVPRLPRRMLLNTWYQEVDTVTGLLEADSAPPDPPPISVLTADARFMPLESESIDLIISSPPYCTRIDYAVKTRLEIDILGGTIAKSFTSLRRSLMGTTSLRNGERELERFPRNIRDMLLSIKQHSSHRAAEYYFPTFLQYFSDALFAMTEISRVLRRGGIAYLVLQNSYFKSVHIDLPENYLELAASLDLHGRVVSSMAVEAHRNKVSVHPGARRYRAERFYYEALIRLEKADA